MKTCICCKLEKNDSDYYISKGSLIGTCKICKRIQHKKWKLNHQETIIAYKHSVNGKKSQLKYDSTLRSRFRKWKGNAKARNIPFDLTFKDISSMPQVCYYSGLDLVLISNHHRTISLDRLDSSKGYTKDNVVLCCGFINIAKNELSYDQFIKSCKLIVLNHEDKELTKIEEQSLTVLA